MSLRFLIVALLVALAGCVTPNRTSELTPPPLSSENTWQQVDSDIVAASQAATKEAKSYARESMESWRALVYQRTETDFIPWFTSYWTQQWLTVKVTWYKLSTKKETDPAVKRLDAYLQEQYHRRVLDPVAKEIDPDVVMGRATKLYVQLLGEQLQGIAQRYGVSADQFDRRLKDIPAISLAPPPAHSASLYQIIHADPITGLPAYVALVDRVRNTAGGAGAGSSDAGISSVAKRASEKLGTNFTSHGVASTAAAAVGGVAGIMISIGVEGFGAIAHEKERPAMEAQLRESLNAAFDDEWRNLLENPATGVMAEVYYLSGHIEGSLVKTAKPAVKSEPVPQEAPLPG